MCKGDLLQLESGGAVRLGFALAFGRREELHVVLIDELHVAEATWRRVADSVRLFCAESIMAAVPYFDVEGRIHPLLELE